MQDDILEKIYRASLRFLIPLSAEETYKAIADEAVKLVNASGATILLMNHGEFQRVYASDPIWNEVKPRKNGYSYSVYKSGKPKIFEADKTKAIHPEVVNLKLHSTIMIPLMNQRKSIGVLNVQSKSLRVFTQRDLHILKLMGSFASLAIRKSQLFEETRNALEMRDLFLSMAAHELRTPLTSISGYTQLLKTKIPEDESNISRWLAGLSGEISRLSLLVNELLEANRIKLGKFQYHLKENHLRMIFDRAIYNLKFISPEREVLIKDELKGKDTIIGDFDKLLQALSNLLENADKFSPIKQPIVVTLKHKKKHVIISIRDEGIGIKKSEVEDIFKSFTRGSNTQKEGMGLGLFLVKDIISRHQGDLKVKSKPNGGTTFTVQLPVVKGG